ncbi:NAD(P)/FAD-dependent oxidoreductase [Lutimaribacter sp. EGI FJ00015]|uniref:NAD(P)/FAD-dependent oxidoreductase n=1 Tax=Lutimaribacter degradans TaxID=2945989 RepID=A0ACC5ZR98_9RHOB|nr:NAD(P)/FAD-dependent oxidoreductase [Lutimaribacter sp. EGI FJ00013]MCM2560680.1 NAD(P)/FAD-dependent oxidoreductase [Lutimaribacter sp. EGI FJ00013]MCO0612376.1 NAD(P)/FAD-dependent oxidoreductase [Lutimaribacter sp. EGI FJ00015]MCO0634504.1 NAD(P)/FAD-dependent oxidoreductase [Lutimaribacter sp. EGI FJ00014]
MQVNTLILGAGAAGLMCAAHSGPGTMVIDHAKAPGEKIRISGGGRCNFTNLHTDPSAFLGRNPHFHKSALARYTQWDFIALVERHGIAWHEKTLGQLFCDDSAKQIIRMLLDEAAGADLWLQSSLVALTHDGTRFTATIDRQGQRHDVTARNLVVATGGKSIPKMGATGLAHDIARQFGHKVTETRPALVPFTFSDGPFRPLSGTACPVRATANGISFEEAALFTHRGLSGPAILQISSYWREGDEIALNLDPDGTMLDSLRTGRARHGRRNMTTALAQHLPARLVDHLAPVLGVSGNLADQSDARLAQIVGTLSDWRLKPTATEGYRTAEVTLGGVETDGLSSKTMISHTVPGLYFIGEAVDVTGWLGGYNFQWAWSSGWAAGTAIAAA